MAEKKQVETSKIPPQSIDAEMSILGAVLIDEEIMADAAEIDRSHMGKIERGERNVTLLNLVRIARALQCQPSALLHDAGL